MFDVGPASPSGTWMWTSERALPSGVAGVWTRVQNCFSLTHAFLSAGVVPSAMKLIGTAGAIRFLALAVGSCQTYPGGSGSGFFSLGGFLVFFSGGSVFP